MVKFCIRSYTPNFYGVFSSRLQGGLPTDRLHAEWWMDSPQVRAVLTDAPVRVPEIREKIVVPGEIREWKRSPPDFAKAEALQNAIRERFMGAFARGLAVVAFTREPEQGPDGDGVYHLTEWVAP